MDFNKIQSETRAVQVNVIIFLWLIFIWQFYIDFRQFLLLKHTTRRPDELRHLSAEKFNRSKCYVIDRIHFSLINSVYAIILSTIEIHFGFYNKYWTLAGRLMPWNNEIIQNCIWFNILYTVYTLFDSPFSLYDSFMFDDYVTEGRTLSHYINNGFKSYIIIEILSVPISALCTYIIKVGGNFFFVWLWVMVMVMYLIWVKIYPRYNSCLRNTYIPCPEGELRTSIENLAAKIKFPLNELLLFENSKYSKLKNSGMVGIAKNRCVILCDKLFPQSTTEGFRNDEILAIVAHEFGHWNNWHYYKILPVLGLYYLSIFGLFSIIYRYDLLFMAFGFPYKVKPKLPGLLATVVYVLAPYNVLATFLINVYTQKLEYEADKFTVKLGMGEALKSALIKLNNGNLVCCVYDPLYSCWKLDHPSLIERLLAIQKLTKNDENDNLNSFESSADTLKSAEITFQYDNKNFGNALFDYRVLTKRLTDIVEQGNQKKYSQSIISVLDSENQNLYKSLTGCQQKIHQNVLQDIFINDNYAKFKDYDEDIDFRNERKAISYTVFLALKTEK